mgnify:CR=1 FL=1
MLNYKKYQLNHLEHTWLATTMVLKQEFILHTMKIRSPSPLMTRNLRECQSKALTQFLTFLVDTRNGYIHFPGHILIKEVIGFILRKRDVCITTSGLFQSRSTYPKHKPTVFVVNVKEPKQTVTYQENNNKKQQQQMSTSITKYIRLRNLFRYQTVFKTIYHLHYLQIFHLIFKPWRWLLRFWVLGMMVWNLVIYIGTTYVVLECI